MPSMYLVGTVHVDLKGPQRLQRLLAHLQPDALLVEYDESRRQMYETFERLPEDKRMRALTSAFPDAHPETLRCLYGIMDYEYGVSRDYANAHPLNEFILADSRGLDTLTALFEYPKVRARIARYFRMSPRGLSVSVARMYRRKKYIFGKNVEDIVTLAELPAADAHAEACFRCAAGRHERIVYVGGLGHLYGAYDDNLYERLQDLEPQRMKLHEADAL